MPNRQGLDAALAAGMKEVAVFMSASETHNKKNVNKTIAETLAAFARRCRPRWRPGCACAPTSRRSSAARTRAPSIPARRVELCRALRALGCYQVSLGDTIGVANPRQVRDVLSRVLAEIPAPEVAVHFHDTRGTALANILVVGRDGHHHRRRRAGRARRLPVRARRVGQRRDRGRRLHAGGHGRRTGIDLDKLIDCSRLASTLVGHEMPSKYYRAAIGRPLRAVAGSMT